MRSLALAVFALVRAGAPLAAQTRSADVSQLEWLAGCWEQRSGHQVIEEQWNRPRGGLMLGTGRTVRGDSLVEYEQVRIEQRAGRLIYAAQPSGQTPADFASITVSETAVTFENPTHDFPQRVMYRRAGRDSLVARVEGQHHGSVRGVDFPYRRVACP
ncbi:MAG: DUF6265 family protein [Gemmatimonadales bacterium]